MSSGWFCHCDRLRNHAGLRAREHLFHGDGSEPEACREGHNAAAGMLRSLIFRQLRIHTVPTLHFVYDTSVDRGFAMDKLIAEALDQNPGK